MHSLRHVMALRFVVALNVLTHISKNYFQEDSISLHILQTATHIC